MRSCGQGGDPDRNPTGANMRFSGDKGADRIRTGATALSRTYQYVNRRFLAVAAGLATIAVLAAPARAHWAPNIPHHNFRHATQLVWCGSSNTDCASARQARAVAWCESRYNQWARNGQYLGLWQLGDYARSRFGFAWNPWAQARAAFAYYYATLLRTGYGWYPWTCRP